VEKRFLTFIVASMLTLMVFSSLSRVLFPPPPLPEEKVVEIDANDGEKADVEEAMAEVDSDAATDDVADSSDDSDESSVDSEIAGVDDGPDDATLASQRRGTMGSLNSASGFQLLVTWNNRGGAIERAELNGTRYTSIDEKYGYLGHLALEDRAEGGCVVGVVGTGTPASNAKSTDGAHVGIEVDDVIVALNGNPVDGKLEFQKHLETTSPGESAIVTVERSADRVKSSLDFSVTLTNRPLEIIRPEPEFATETDPQHPLSYLMEISQVGSRTVDIGKEKIKGLPSLSKAFWDVEVNDSNGSQTVEFSFLLSDNDLKKIGYSGSVRIVKRYTLSPATIEDGSDGYHLDFDIEFQNTGGEPLEIAYRLDGPTGLPYEGWWYAYKVHPTSWGGAGIRDIIYRFDGAHQMMPNPAIVKKTTKSPDAPYESLLETPKPLAYIGVDGQYFASTLVPNRPTDEDVISPDAFAYREAICRTVAGVDKIKNNRTDVSFRLDSVPKVIAANESLSQSFKIFAGPKKPEILSNYGLSDCISYGWFAAIAKGLTRVLHFFYGIIGNYGIAIILLTVMVRGSLLWFGRQQAMNAARMQELAPEMKKIAEKYKDDMQKRSEAQRELFRKNNYNPLSGCLPMVFQLPIFVGLYRALSVDIELRQASLIPGLEWCSNLAAPDQLFRWDSFMPSFLAGTNGFLGPYFNILPLFSVGLMIVHQKLFSPPPADEQQEMQMKMMKYMMVIFGFMFFRVPAGLCLYFITSSLWAVGERKLLPKPKVKKAIQSADPPTPSSTASKQNSLLNKLSEAIDQKKKQPIANGAARKKERDQKRKQSKKNR
jgi:YidC/Oxa1 family membrane protein insertase